MNQQETERKELKKSLAELKQAIAAHVEPAIYPSITQQVIDG